MTEMFGEAWSPMSVPDLAPDDDDDMERAGPLKGKSNRQNQNVSRFQTFIFYRDWIIIYKY